MRPRAVVLVEGESDRIALETLALRRGRKLAAEGVDVVPIGGAQAIGRVLAGYGEVRVGGLYDIGEQRAVLRGLERAGVAEDGFFACDPDLEGELVRALGAERMLALVESRGHFGAFETYRKQPAKRAKPLEAQLHGWLHNWKIRYAAALVEALELDRVPRPLEAVLEWVGPRTEPRATPVVIPANDVVDSAGREAVALTFIPPSPPRSVRLPTGRAGGAASRRRPVPTVATVGVYGWTLQRFLDALQDADVGLVVDVRQRRGVRGSEYAWANAGRLQTALAEAGIGYSHHKELAPTTELRQLQYRVDDELGVGKRSRTELAPAYKERYLREILDGADLEPLVAELSAVPAAALLCVERDAEACHRSLVAARLADEHGVRIVHLRPAP